LRIGELLTPANGSGVAIQGVDRGIATAHVNGVAGDDGLGTDSDALHARVTVGIESRIGGLADERLPGNGAGGGVDRIEVAIPGAEEKRTVGSSDGGGDDGAHVGLPELLNLVYVPGIQLRLSGRVTGV